uniref:Putative ovule protein n=1 Tax=Solanum chacoense TaxID=4108 RepID=A0A0V0GQ43_SOLCH
MLLLLPSKHLVFRSFHSVHQIHAGMVIHQFSFDPLLLIPFQQLSSSIVDFGITQLTPKNIEEHVPQLCGCFTMKEQMKVALCVLITHKTS